MTIKSKVNAGGFQLNHNQSGLAMKSKLKAGGFQLNHNQSAR